MIRLLVLIVSVFAAVIVQDFLPGMPFFAGAHVLLVPVIVCYALLWLPFPAALAFALYAGLLGDLGSLHIDGDHVEIGLGWSMLYYVLLTAVLRLSVPSGTAPRWETHCLVSGAAVFFLLAGQYLMIGLRRESLAFDGAAAARIFGPAVAALLIAPALCFFFGILPGDTLPPRARRTGR